jgi:hypothetical protein
VGITFVTPEQIDELKRVKQKLRPLNYQRAEGLRRRGYLERDTLYAVGRDYADHRGVHEQFRSPTPVKYHDWYLTDKGAQAIEAHSSP